MGCGQAGRQRTLDPRSQVRILAPQPQRIFLGQPLRGAIAIMKGLAALVLAAGKGTRMRSRLPKVLHPLAGRPLLYHVLAAVEGLTPSAELAESGEAPDDPGPIVVVVSPDADPIRAAFVGRCLFATQQEQLGTAH